MDGSSLRRLKRRASERTIFTWTVTNFVVTILIVTVSLTGTFFILATGQIESIINEQNKILLNAVMDRTESLLEQTTGGMQELGNTLSGLSVEDEETLARIIDGARIGASNLRSIDLIGPDARILYSSPYDATNIGNDASGRLIYQRVVANGTPAWSRVFYADFLNDVVITFYVPAGPYVLAGNLSLQRLWASMETIDVSDDTHLSVIDSNGAYIYHSDLTKVDGRMFAPNRQELQEATQSEVPVIHHTYQGERTRTEVANIVGADWLVAVHQSERVHRQAQNRLIVAALVVLVLTLLIGVVFIYHGARRGLKPFAQLQIIALRIAGGDYNVAYPESRFVEIRTLSESFRSMVAGITQREISLRDARDESDRASQAKSELLSNVSHEFRTSLNGIMGMSSLLSKTELDETQSQFLQAQLQAARILKRLVDDLLEVSTDEFDIRYQPSETDLHLTIESLKTLVRDDNSNVRFEWINEVPPGTVAKIDEERLGQIVIHLISNGRKYTDDGSLTVCWKLRDESEEQTLLQVTVRDTGIGIPQEERNRIFDSFVQLDSTHTKTKRGLGLGLTIVKRLCNLAGGSVSISDNTVEGRGTEITVRIPVERGASATGSNSGETLVSVDADQSGTTHSSSTVLIVEDDAINRMYLSTVLKRNGYDIREYASGVQLIDEQPFPDVDAILMDIGLPHISGLEVTEEIRNRGILIPIIALTAYSSQSDVEAYREARMNGFIPKPITEKILFRVLRDALAGREWTVVRTK